MVPLQKALFPLGGPELATTKYVWWVLRVGLTTETFVQAFMDGRIRRITSDHFAGPGWRYTGELKLNSNSNSSDGDVDTEWFQAKLGPLGITTWADKILHHTCKIGGGACTGCGDVGTKVWHPILLALLA